VQTAIRELTPRLSQNLPPRVKGVLDKALALDPNAPVTFEQVKAIFADVPELKQLLDTFLTLTPGSAPDIAKQFGLGNNQFLSNLLSGFLQRSVPAFTGREFRQFTQAYIQTKYPVA